MITELWTSLRYCEWTRHGSMRLMYLLNEGFFMVVKITNPSVDVIHENVL